MKQIFKYSFFTFIMLSLSLFAVEIDITNKSHESWTLELTKETLLEDIYISPFDYEYINDNIYLVINRMPGIAVYNLSGELIFLNDKKGEGPGEFGSPVYIWNNPDEKGIMIYDEGHFKYHLFDYEMNYQRSENIAPQQFINKIYHAKNALYKNESMVDFTDGEVTFKHALQYINAGEITELYTTDCHMFLKGWFHYNQPVSQLLSDERLVTAIQSRTQYKIMIFSKGNLIQNITKHIKPVRFSDEEIDETREFAEQTEKNFSVSFKTPEEVITNQMVISDIAVTTDDHIWILTRDEDGQYFDIITPDGTLKAVARSSSNAVFARPYVANNNLYVVVENDNEEFYLKQYRIIR